MPLSIGARTSRNALLSAAVAAAVTAALSRPLSAQAPAVQFAPLGKRHLPADEDATQSLVWGDVDGDGDLDLVTGNGHYVGQQNRLYRNDGHGVLTDVTGTNLPARADYTTAVALGDVDGDGDLDLVVGEYYQQVRLLLNNGSGVFTDVTAARLPALTGYIRSIQFGDVDGDSDVDVVIGSYYDQTRLLLNNGGGTFTDASVTRMPALINSCYSTALGDVDGDGDLDVVVGNSYGQNRLYRNIGCCTFPDAPAAQMPVRVASSGAIVLGDVDGDGDLDV
ncbi:MAG: VCBS repeat-containing protein, partial [Planctomycetes bacterium]|nr:VCBS repeat-containing protein [Planctomycetota bacterium]